jgi:predicted RecA/RadA family phage recombinase
MPLVTFVQEGSAVDYTPNADVEAGAVVVQNDLVGVTKRKILANELGALHVAGGFDFPKATGVGTAIAAGLNVYWDVAEQVAKTSSETGANKLIGKTIAAAGDNDATVRVRMSQ